MIVRNPTSADSCPSRSTARAGRGAAIWAERKDRPRPPLIRRFPADRLESELQQVRAFFERYLQSLTADRRHLLDRYRASDLGKASAAVEEMGPKALTRCARLCGAVLARANARSGDATAITGYLGEDDSFDRAITTYAVDYARRNKQDHATILATIASGELPVIRDI